MGRFPIALVAVVLGGGAALWIQKQSAASVVPVGGAESADGGTDEEQEEREARTIEALVQLGQIGEAHTEAMIFVQHHPAGPYSQHIMNLMGVHPRPHGAVPERRIAMGAASADASRQAGAASADASRDTGAVSAETSHEPSAVSGGEMRSETGEAR